MTISQLIEKYNNPLTGEFKNNAPLKALNALKLRNFVEDLGGLLGEISGAMPFAQRTEWLSTGVFPITPIGAGVGSIVDSQVGYFGLLQLATTGALGGAHVTTSKFLMEQSFVMKTVMKLPLLSTAPDSFYYRFGLLADPTVRNQVDGVYFEYSHDVNGGQWMFNSYKAGVLSQVLSTIPVVINTRYELSLRYLLNNAVVFNINGIDVATIPQVNLPLQTILMQYANGVRKYNGALNRNVLIDSDLLVYNLAQ